jgi:protein-S-isoprenylcysteine O-methyltransferase Ste14
MSEVPPDSGPSFRLWPPVSVGAPLVVGLVLTSSAGDPWGTSRAATTVGWALVAVFVVWNGWALSAMARHGTGLLPGRPSTTVLDRGPFGISRNPLYVGLLVLSAGVALLAGSLWAVLALPLEWAYADYRSRVRRWI